MISASPTPLLPPPPPPTTMDPGVRGLSRTRTRSQQSESVVETEMKQNTATQQQWGGEDEAMLATRHAQWQKLRAAQMAQLNEMWGMKDVVKAVVVVLAFRAAARAIGMSGRVAAMYLLSISLVRTLYINRAPSHTTFSSDHFVTWPIVGQIGFVYSVLTKSALQTQIDNAKRNGFRSSSLVMFGGLRDISIMLPQDREYYLKTNWRNFSKNMDGIVGFQELFAEVMGRGIFAVDGEEWQDHRKVASHLFSGNGLRFKMESCFTEHGQSLVRLLKDKARTGETFDFQEVCQALTFDTISDIAFGSFPGALQAYMTNKAKVDFLVRFDRVQQTCTLRIILPEPVWKTMRWLNIGPEKQIREDAIKIRSYVQRVVDESRTKINGNHDCNDLLSLYIKTAQVMKKSYMDDDAYLSDAVLNFMIAGRDTTSCTLINLFRFLHENPQVAKKMREEFMQVIGREGHVSWDDVRALRYGNAVFNEVLRLRPPVPGDMRFCNEDCTLPSGLYIPKGTRVSIMNAAIGRDPSLWSQPDEFLPERWMMQDKHNDKMVRRVDEFVHPVFWGGPRLCLGKDMARLEVLNIAWSILKEFDIVLESGQDDITLNGPVQFFMHGVKVVVKEVKM